MRFVERFILTIALVLLVSCQNENHSRTLDDRGGPEEAYIAEFERESIQVLEEHGAQFVTLLPAYESDVEMQIEGPIYLLEAFPDSGDLPVAQLFSILNSQHEPVTNTFRQLRESSNTRLLFAPRLRYTGLAVSKEVDANLHQSVLNGQPDYVKKLDSLLLVGRNIFDRAFVHEFHHIKEINSGRLIRITEDRDALQKELPNDVEGSALVLLDAYFAVTEITAEYANYRAFREELSRFPNFLSFMQGPAFYPGLHGQIVGLNERLSAYQTSEELAYRELICQFIADAMRATELSGKLTSEIFSACTFQSTSDKPK